MRALRLEAAYLVARLAAHARTQNLAHGLEARGRAIDRYFEQEASLAVRVAAWLGARSARADGPTPATRAAELDAELGVLRAERARLDARLQAELQAFVTTRRVLKIRLSGL